MEFCTLICSAFNNIVDWQWELMIEQQCNEKKVRSQPWVLEQQHDVKCIFIWHCDIISCIFDVALTIKNASELLPFILLYIHTEGTRHQSCSSFSAQNHDFSRICKIPCGTHYSESQIFLPIIFFNENSTFSKTIFWHENLPKNLCRVTFLVLFFNKNGQKQIYFFTFFFGWLTFFGN